MTRMKTKAIFLVLMAVLVAACAGPKKKKGGADADSRAKASDDADANAIPDVNVEEASIHGKEFQKVEGLEPIHFDYDSASLRDEQLATLKKNADYLKANKGLELLVAGFCDDRGTIEYNLALGQKRAKEVREYYIRLGVNGKSMATISYGKESPSCTEATEACWAENRRAETRVRSRVAQRANDKQPQ
jgi:peptidoglycan-associated lipoprotein